MPTKWSIQTKIFAGFAAAASLLLLVDFVALLSLNQLMDTVRRQLHAYEVLDDLDELLSLLQDAETGQRGYLLTGDERYLEPYHAAAPAAAADLGELRYLTSDNAAHQDRLDRLQPLIDEKLAELRDTIALRQSAGFAAAMAVVETGAGKRVMDEIRALVAETKEAEHSLLLDRQAAAAASGRRSIRVIFIGSLLGAVVLIPAVLIIRRDERRRARAEEGLRRAHGDLETRVVARTSELESANRDLQGEIEQRRRAEERLAEAMAQIGRSRDDLVSILDRLELAVAMTDRQGRVTYLSDSAGRRFGIAAGAVDGALWEEAFSFAPADRERVRGLMAPGCVERAKTPARLEGARGRQYWFEIEVLDDPRDPQRKVLVFHDVTEVYDLRRQVDEPYELEDLVGASAPMRRVFHQIRELAQVDASVLIEGETGTGKELTARAIHRQSHRRNDPFVAVHAASLSESLLASQLFGHRRGAFTGAVADHVGFFEAAHRGTLFLDEIGDIPYELQTMLLRALQENEVVRVGETRPRKVDVRVLAATQHDLLEAVRRGRFRADLLYRIRVGRVLLPPLRSRREDIPHLVGRFLTQRLSAAGRRVDEVHQEAMAVLLDYDWPGNVRELKSAVEFACIHAAGPVIQPADLPPEVLDHGRRTILGEPGLGEDERGRFLGALARTGGNRKEAARLLGISRATFYRRLAALGLAATADPGPN